MYHRTVQVSSVINPFTQPCYVTQLSSTRWSSCLPQIHHTTAKYTTVVIAITRQYIILLPIKYTMVILSPSDTTHYCPVVYGNTISQRCITLLPSCVYQFHLPRYITLLPSCVYQSYLSAMHHLVTAQLCVPILCLSDASPYCPVCSPSTVIAWRPASGITTGSKVG